MEVWRCEECHDFGWVRARVRGGADWQTEVVRCVCGADELRRQRYERARRLSDLAPSLVHCTFARYDGKHNAEAAYAAECWANHPDGSPDGRPSGGSWLVLWGAPGTGKSHLLAAAFGVLCDRGMLPLYAVVPLLLDRLREGMDAGEGEYQRRLSAVLNAPVLLLDDVGAESRSAWTDETLYKLFDHRYRHELPTAAALNVDPATDLEPRISSRLGDLALARVCRMAGPDYRRASVRSSVRSSAP